MQKICNDGYWEWWKDPWASLAWTQNCQFWTKVHRMSIHRERTLVPWRTFCAPLARPCVPEWRSTVTYFHKIVRNLSLQVQCPSNTIWLTNWMEAARSCESFFLTESCEISQTQGGGFSAGWCDTRASTIDDSVDRRKQGAKFMKKWIGPHPEVPHRDTYMPRWQIKYGPIFKEKSFSSFENFKKT